MNLFTSGFIIPGWTEHSVDSELERYFYSLPDEIQQGLINRDICSEKSLYDCIEKYKLKE